jgi:predicted phage terminase large subunit-like protein
MDALPPSTLESTPTQSPSSPTTTEGPQPALILSLAAYQAEVARRQRERVERNADQIRERCKSFAGFVREAWHVLEPETRYIHNWHIDAICKHLEAITFGRLKPRLIINISPGSMKSLLVSVMWQAWMWGPCGMPAKRFVSTSFEVGNVERDTGKTRDLIMSDWFQSLWPLSLVRQARLDFANSDTGSRIGVAFSALMGKRGDVLTIDDPHSLDGAESDVQRGNAVKRFLEGGKSRVNDRAKSAIVIVQQRIHTDDLAGAVLAEDLGYIHLNIPMEFEEERRCITYDKDGNEFWRDPRTVEGELMDPKRFTASDAEDEKKQGYSWSGQYQQAPVPREGNLFDVDKIEVVAASPGGGQAVRGWDLAGTKRKKSAFTVGLLLRRAHTGTLVIEDVKRIRGKPNDVKILAKETAVEDGPTVLQSFPQDPGQAGVHQRNDYAELLEGHTFRFSPETGDKAFRAQGIASQVAAERVVMVRAPWNAALKEEMRSFPNTLFKDQVDALSRAYMELVADKPLPANAGPEIVTVEGTGPAGRQQVIDHEIEDPWAA